VCDLQVLYREDYANMGCFKEVKLWWKRHVKPGPSGRVEELKKQLKELVAKQKQSDAHITKMQTNLRDQIRMTECLGVMIREKMQESDRRREATLRGLKTSLGVKLNKDSEREESEAPLRGQKKIQGS